MHRCSEQTFYKMSLQSYTYIKKFAVYVMQCRKLKVIPPIKFAYVARTSVLMFLKSEHNRLLTMYIQVVFLLRVLIAGFYFPFLCCLIFLSHYSYYSDLLICCSHCRLFEPPLVFIAFVQSCMPSPLF